MMFKIKKRLRDIQRNWSHFKNFFVFIQKYLPLQIQRGFKTKNWKWNSLRKIQSDNQKIISRKIVKTTDANV